MSNSYHSPDGLPSQTREAEPALQRHEQALLSRKSTTRNGWRREPMATVLGPLFSFTR